MSDEPIDDGYIHNVRDLVDCLGARWLAYHAVALPIVFLYPLLLSPSKAAYAIVAVPLGLVSLAWTWAHIWEAT